MALTVYNTRLYLYCSFLFWSFLLFALTIARLSYTTHLPRGDPLNGGHDFTDPSVIALLVSALFAMPFSAFMIYVLHRGLARSFTLVYIEVAVASVLWVLWLGSTAAGTNVWPDLSFCVQFRACTNLQAMLAFAWLGWITLSLLLLITVVIASRSNAWSEYSHGPWADRSLFPGMSPAGRGESVTATSVQSPRFERSLPSPPRSNISAPVMSQQGGSVV